MSPCSEESIFPIEFPIEEDEHSAKHDPDRCTPQAEPDAGLMPTADSAASGSDAGLMPTSDPFWPTAPVRRWQMPVRPSGSVPSTASGSGGHSAGLEQLGERPAADRPGPYASADRPRLRAVGTAANPAAVPKAGPWKASVPLGADRAPLILPPGAGHEPVLMAPPPRRGDARRRQVVDQLCGHPSCRNYCEDFACTSCAVHCEDRECTVHWNIPQRCQSRLIFCRARHPIADNSDCLFCRTHCRLETPGGPCSYHRQTPWPSLRSGLRTRNGLEQKHKCRYCDKDQQGASRGRVSWWPPSTTSEARG